MTPFGRLMEYAKSPSPTIIFPKPLTYTNFITYGNVESLYGKFNLMMTCSKPLKSFKLKTSLIMEERYMHRN